MKTKIHIIISAILMMPLFLQGCNDDKFLEEKSYILTTDVAFTTPAQIEMGLNYLHNRVQWLMLYQTSTHNFMINGVGLDTFAALQSWFITSDWTAMTPMEIGYNRHWYQFLSQIIQYANIVKEAAEETDANAWPTPTKKAETIGEALFFRAWAHRSLVGMFGDWPIITEATRSAKVDFVRQPRVDVWKQCAADLELASQTLPKETNQPGRIVKAAADHLLAEVCISVADHSSADKAVYLDKSIKAANRVINKEDGDYELMKDRFGKRATEKGKNPYWDLFRAGNFNYQEGNNEAIWVVQYDYTAGVSGKTGTRPENYVERQFLSQYYHVNHLIPETSTQLYGDGAIYFYDKDGKAITSGSGNDSTGQTWLILRPTNYFLYDVWKNKGTDYRGSEVMIQRNLQQAGGRLWKDVFAEVKASSNAQYMTANDTCQGVFPRIWKFSTDKHINGAPNLYDGDWYMMRLSETYLLRAEAYMKSGDKASAMADINTVRDRATAPLLTDQNDVTMDYILDERARELFGEEARLITLTRLSTKESPLLVERVRKYGWTFPNLPTGPRQPNIANHQWIYPIPVSLIEANSGAVFEQNEGY